MQLPKPLYLFTPLRHFSGRFACIGGLLLLFCLSFNGAVAAQQEKVSAVFPAERHKELMDKLSYQQKKEEAEDDKPDDKSWWESDLYKNWDFNLSSTTSIIILILLLAGLGFLIFRILGDVEMRKRTKGNKEEEDKIDLNDLKEEQLVAQGVSLSLLERAEQAGQYDIAVRLLYIQLLKELQDGGLIKYRRDFSNRDYQQQLRNSAFLADFREVTVDYERYWYGKYPIERLGYRLVHRKFITLHAAIQAATAKPNAYA